MKKLLIKLFCPSAKSLSEMAAKAIKDGVNGFAEDRKAVVAKYSSLAKTVSATTNKIVTMTEDATIDAKEEEEIAAMIEPLIENIFELI